ncbi:uncharacterized protein [Littorina saxatilis]|uniref:uncharacterized protein n=1 Tax=Littorina saxatilis TaxID=31220 RepID=UPI0038B4C4EF
MSGSKSRNAALASFSTPDHGNSPPRMTLTTPKHMDGAAVDPIEKSSSLTSAQEIIAARGRALGVRSGAALAKYVQEEEAAQRRLLQEEEAAQRRLLQEEEEAQLRKEEAQRRLLQEEEEAQLRKEEAQRRLQREEQDAQRRLQREEEEIRRKILREEEENDRRRRLAELEEERVRAEIEKTRREETTSSSRSRAIEPVRLKIDPFDEAKEDLDTFLGRFERAATLSGWDRESDWGARLGALLKGFAADVYLELPAEDAGNFDVIVDALRGSFRWTADSYRSKFRLAAKRGEETFIQFATRLRIWFERWRKAAKKEETYAGIRDLLLMEHLMDHVSGDLADFIRQREPANVTEAAELAERFAASKRARKNPVTATGRVEKNTKDIENPEEDSAPVSPVHPNGPFPKRNCYGCGKTGHIRRNCPHSASSFNVRTVTNVRTVVTMPGTTAATSELPTLCDPCSQLSYTPLCTVSINGSQVSALRDTGADGLVIDSSLVKDCNLKQGSQTIRFAAGNVQKTCPTTIVHLESPFFSGNVVAIVADQLTYPVLIGNRIIQPGGETLEVPVYRAKAQPVKIAAITQVQNTREKEPPKTLRMKDSGLGVTREKLIQLQTLDPTLSRVRELAKGRNPTPSGKKGKVKFLWKQGVLHRLFITTEKTFSQVVVPETLRSGILRRYHNVTKTGHLETKKTKNRLWHSFYWPGMEGDIRRYVHSCDVGHRALPKGGLPKAHLGKMPLIDEPFRRIAVDRVGTLTVSERENRYRLITSPFNLYRRHR